MPVVVLQTEALLLKKMGKMVALVVVNLAQAQQ